MVVWPRQLAVLVSTCKAICHTLYLYIDPAALSSWPQCECHVLNTRSSASHTAQMAEEGPTGAWAINEKVLVPHTDKYYEAKVLKAELREDGIWYYFLHYNGWNKKYDEWVEATGLTKCTQGDQPVPTAAGVGGGVGVSDQIQASSGARQQGMVCPVISWGRPGCEWGAVGAVHHDASAMCPPLPRAPQRVHHGALRVALSACISGSPRSSRLHHPTLFGFSNRPGSRTLRLSPPELVTQKPVRAKGEARRGTRPLSPG